jgi:2',3'-cyclic-nucleotide 2'-phosphodiesterase (5'-nucleotidase family)
MSGVLVITDDTRLIRVWDPVEEFFVEIDLERPIAAARKEIKRLREAEAEVEK